MLRSNDINLTWNKRVERGCEVSYAVNFSILQIRKLRSIKNKVCAVTHLRCKGLEKQEPTCQFPALSTTAPVSIISNKERMQSLEFISCCHEKCSQGLSQLQD